MTYLEWITWGTVHQADAGGRSALLPLPAAERRDAKLEMLSPTSKYYC